MVERFAIWFFPFLGMVSLGLVWANRRAILRPESRRDRFLRWNTPLLVFGFGLWQSIHAVSFYEKRQDVKISAAVFGILGCVGALALYASYRWHWLEERE